MYSEVNVAVEDGNLGRNGNTESGAQVKIGVAGAGGSSFILIKNTMSPAEIQEKLGYSPLADACIDATENGLKTIYALPMQADVAGEAGEVAHTGTGEGTVAVSGSPNNAYDVVVSITETGNTNEAAFAYSINGGNSFSDELTVPEGGEYEIPGTGLTITFADSEADSFVEGDAYAFATTAPTMSNASVLKAVAMLHSFNKPVEVCHIVGTSAKDLWAALQTEADELMNTYKKPLIFLLEGRPCGDEEGIDEYLGAMEKERKGITSRYLCIVLSYATYQRKDLRVQDINMAGVISGLIGRAKESLSIGCVEEFPVSSAKLASLLPEGIGEYSRELDAMGYTVFRQYDGKEDYYVSNANVMSPESSDFKYVESVRVLNRLVRAVSILATDKLQGEVDPGNIEASVKAFEAYLNIAVEEAQQDKVISSGEVKIETEGLNILADETLNVSVTWVPMGTVRVFNITFAVSNPAGSGIE